MKEETKHMFTKKVWPFLVSASGAILMLLAFFIPSVQDQWDRYQARRIIQQYVEIGEDFVSEGNYEMAEQAFAKAYDLSEGKRLDIEVRRLAAKINRIYQDPEWGSEPPADLDEVDFEFLLHFQKGPDHTKRRASILTSYGIYLASVGKSNEAQGALEEAIQLNPENTLAYINLGNLMDQVGKTVEAEKAYLKAISIDSGSVLAHYNLGLLLYEQGKLSEAEKEFATATKLDPTDSDAIMQRRFIRRELKVN
jgi:tetratricopeptide (TPR) repeat protein